MSSAEPYLGDFQKLGDQIFLSIKSQAKSDTQATFNDRDSPDLIIICSWMYAAPRHISKYVKKHQTLYPRASILLLRQDGGDLIWRPRSWQMQNMKPAVSVIQSLTQEKTGDTSKILLHIFSNGGAYTATQLVQAYEQSNTTTRQNMPLTCLIIDSAPSLPNALRGFVALSEALPKSAPLRLLGSAAILSFIFVAGIMNTTGLSEDSLMAMRKRLNDSQGAFMQSGLNRMYIYSHGDKLVPWQDVEAHADEAASLVGKDKVRLEDFGSSNHVSHAMIDNERYWGLVKQFWDICTA